MKEKKFKIGQSVTFKKKSECSSQYRSSNAYYFGGDDYGGKIGKVTNYKEFVNSRDCYKIEVYPPGYVMLESEFEEYNIPEDIKTSSKEVDTSSKEGDFETYFR